MSDKNTETRKWQGPKAKVYSHNRAKVEIREKIVEKPVEVFPVLNKGEALKRVEAAGLDKKQLDKALQAELIHGVEVVAGEYRIPVHGFETWLKIAEALASKPGTGND